MKFEVTHDPVEKLVKGEITELPAHVPVYPYFPKQHLQGLFAVFGLWFDDGSFDLQPGEGSLNLNSRFPDVKPLKVKGILEKLYSIP